MKNLEKNLETNTEMPMANHISFERMILELQDSSKNKRGQDEHGNEIIITPEGEKFFVNKLSDAKDPRTKEAHAFMLKQFGNEESEAFDWFKQTIEEKLNDYFIIEDEHRNIVALSNTQTLNLEQPQNPEEPSGLIIAVWHIMTDRSLRKKGLGSELYYNIYNAALSKARVENKNVKGIIGETVSSVEPFLNRMGRKRIYFEDLHGNIHEVPYVCPPVDYDFKTGEPLEDPESEHIMLRLIPDSTRISTIDFINIIKALYKEYLGTESDHDSQDVYNQVAAYQEELLGKLKTTIAESKDGSLFFMTKSEREAKEKELAVQSKKLIEVKSTR